MQSFDYTARDKKSGQKISAQVDAENESRAAQLLISRGLVPIEIKSKQVHHRANFFAKKQLSKQRVIFSRQLATLVSAGLPLIQSLNSVHEQTTNKTLKAVINEIIAEVEAGTPLAKAMGNYPNVFDQVYVSLVAAGETSGTLDKSLERLADQQEKDSAVVSKVNGALVYPAIILLVLFAVVVFMMTTVLPSVQGLYQDLPGAQLPAITQLLLSASHALRNYWWIFILVIVGGFYFLKRYFKSVAGSELADNLKLKMPLISPLYQKLYMARFSRIGGTLMASGVPILQMLDSTSASVDNVHIQAAINRAIEKVKGGKALSESLQAEHVFTKLVPEMIKIGEQSGALEQMLSRLADYYESEVENQIKTVSTIIEPVLMVAVGIIALIIVAAVLLPIYNLAGKVSGL